MSLEFKYVKSKQEVLVQRLENGLGLEDEGGAPLLTIRLALFKAL